MGWADAGSETRKSICAPQEEAGKKRRRRALPGNPGVGSLRLVRHSELCDAVRRCRAYPRRLWEDAARLLYGAVLAQPVGGGATGTGAYVLWDQGTVRAIVHGKGCCWQLSAATGVGGVDCTRVEGRNWKGW